MFMSQNLFLGFPLPVALALAALVLILLALARVLMPLRKPVPVRIPPERADLAAQGDIDAGRR
jgi:heme A synthase